MYIKQVQFSMSVESDLMIHYFLGWHKKDISVPSDTHYHTAEFIQGYKVNRLSLPQDRLHLHQLLD